MSAELLTYQMEQDFENLAKEHEAAAENEHIWALGSSDVETNRIHSENVRHHKLLAKVYRKMKEDTLAFVETYDDTEC